MEYYGAIFAFAESPKQKGVLWAGIGRRARARLARRRQDVAERHAEGHGGRTRACRSSSRRTSRRARRTSPRTASSWTTCSRTSGRPTDYGADVDAHRRGHRRTHGVHARHPRGSTRSAGLLYAGTERGVWFSLDDGATLAALQLNLPPVPVHDLAVKEGDLIAATHGRSFWVIDDISPLRQLTPALTAKDAHLFKPRDAYRVSFARPRRRRRWWRCAGAAPLVRRCTRSPASPAGGPVVNYWLKRPDREVVLEFLDAQRHAHPLVHQPAGFRDGGRLRHARGAQRSRRLHARAGIPADSAERMVRRTPRRRARGRRGRRGRPASARRRRRACRTRRASTASPGTCATPMRRSFDGHHHVGGRHAGPDGASGHLPGAACSWTASRWAPRRFALKKDPRTGATQADLRAQFAFLQAGARPHDAGERRGEDHPLRARAARRPREAAHRCRRSRSSGRWPTPLRARAGGGGGLDLPDEEPQRAGSAELSRSASTTRSPRSPAWRAARRPRPRSRRLTVFTQPLDAARRRAGEDEEGARRHAARDQQHVLRDERASRRSCRVPVEGRAEAAIVMDEESREIGGS